MRVSPESLPGDPMPSWLAKLDLEGAEHDAVRVLWPSVEAGLLEHAMIEVTPAFRDDYPDLIASLVNVGYEVYALPDKALPPLPLDGPDDLVRLDKDPAGLRVWIEGCGQANLWLKHSSASF